MRSFWWVISMVSVLGAGTGVARAQSSDRPAPALAVPADSDPPGYVFALTGDVLGVALGHYSISLELAFAPAHAVWIAPSYASSSEASGFGIEAGYHLWPLAEGTEGFFVGPHLGAASASSEQGTATVLSGGAELGWQVVWGGLALGLAAGASVANVRGSDRAATWAVVPRLRVTIGWAWM